MDNIGIYNDIGIYIPGDILCSLSGVIKTEDTDEAREFLVMEI